MNAVRDTVPLLAGTCLVFLCLQSVSEPPLFLLRRFTLPTPSACKSLVICGGQFWHFLPSSVPLRSPVPPQVAPNKSSTMTFLFFIQNKKENSLIFINFQNFMENWWLSFNAWSQRVLNDSYHVFSSPLFRCVSSLSKMSETPFCKRAISSFHVSHPMSIPCWNLNSVSPSHSTLGLAPIDAQIDFLRGYFGNTTRA